MAVAALAAIGASCLFIYRTQFRAPKYNVELHEHIGQVLAEQTANLVGKKGRVVTLVINTKEWPELKTQTAAFKARLRQLGDFELREYELDTKDQPKYGVGRGLSGRRYVRTVKKNTTASAFVSFVGAPVLNDEELADLASKPRLIAESSSPDNLVKLFADQMLSVAVVSRFEFPAPGPEHPKTAEEWFTKRYQVLTPSTVASMPTP